MLGSAAHSGSHLVRLCRAHHEADMRRRLFQGFQQSVLGASGEHVHFVEHIHLAAAWRAERHLGNQISDVFHLVVGGGVQLVKVVGSAGSERQARFALPARLAV